MGQLRAPLLRALPGARYIGLEVSDYLAERYGWIHEQIASFQAEQPFDLVICYDVLQYLTAHAAARAISNLSRLCRGILYFSALTTQDWRENCDQKRTDPNVHMRSGSWYRRRLARQFVQAGAGLWLKRDAPLVVWELEKAGRTMR